MEFNEFFTPAVIWFLIGLAFLLLELAVPGLILIFFGVGAWLTSLGIIIFDYNLNVQLFVFVLSSVFMLLLLRRFLKRKFFTDRTEQVESYDDEFTGSLATAETNLTPGVSGKVIFKGAAWSAISDSEITAGDTVKITGKESITLKVTSIK